MPGHKSILAVALDDEITSSLHEAARCIAASPSEFLGVSDIKFEPYTVENVNMTYVLLTDAFQQLPEVKMLELHHSLQEQVLASGPLNAPFQFRGFEVFSPAKVDLLIARFTAPDTLATLRKSIWRTCREFHVSYPDAHWIPYIVLGTLKAQRNQLKHITCNQLTSFMPKDLVRPLGLKMVSSQSRDVPCNWDETLRFPLHSDQLVCDSSASTAPPAPENKVCPPSSSSKRVPAAETAQVKSGCKTPVRIEDSSRMLS